MKISKLKNKLIFYIRQFIFRLEEKYPPIGKPLVFIWRVLCALKFIIAKRGLKMKAKLEYKNDKLDFDKIYLIDPRKIEFCLKIPFNKWQNYGKILSGDWDTPGPRFEELDSYLALKQRFREGKSWDQTEFYQRLLGYILNGEVNRGCKNKEELDERFRKIDLLYHQIREGGYKSKKELYSPETMLEKIEGPSALLDEISVVIGRSGQILFVDGRHRLAIAKLIGLSEIPVRIITRHEKWMEFRQELIAFSKNYQGGELYQPLTHIDLQDIPHRRNRERFQIIKNNVVSRGTLLDIGANLGYFCHKFEELGFDCHALEENRLCLYFLGKLKEAEGRRFKIIPQSLFDYQKNQKIKFDVVLALSVFHHFLETEQTYFNFIRFLKNLETRELIFECSCPEEFRSRNLYKRYAPEEFIDFITENSNLRKAEFLGKSEEGRPIYKLTP